MTQDTDSEAITRPMRPLAQRVVFVPDDYRKGCELGWRTGDATTLDTGQHPSGPGQIWNLGDES